MDAIGIQLLSHLFQARTLMLVFWNLLADLNIVFLALIAVLCLWKFPLLPKRFQKICYLIWFNLSIEIGARVLAELTGNNLPLLHIYTLGEFLLLSYFYRGLLTAPRFLSKNFDRITLFISLLIIANTLFLQSIYGFNTYAKTAVQFIFILYAILYFFDLSEQDTLELIEKKYLRLINSAILIYYSGSLFIFMFSNYFLQNNLNLPSGLWAFNAILNLVFLSLVSFSLWQIIYRKTKLSS